MANQRQCRHFFPSSFLWKRSISVESTFFSFIAKNDHSPDSRCENSVKKTRYIRPVFRGRPGTPLEQDGGHDVAVTRNSADCFRFYRVLPSFFFTGPENGQKFRPVEPGHRHCINHSFFLAVVMFYRALEASSITRPMIGS